MKMVYIDILNSTCLLMIKRKVVNFCVLTLYDYAAYYHPRAFHYSNNKIYNKCISQACNALTSGSQIGGELVSRAHLETFLVFTPGRGFAAGIRWVETRDASKYPTVNRTGFS